MFPKLLRPSGIFYFYSRSFLKMFCLGYIYNIVSMLKSYFVLLLVVISRIAPYIASQNISPRTEV